MENLNFEEGIHYLVTRPIEQIEDIDGQGNYNLSPIGFPVQNVSGELNQNPTRITPEFTLGYNNVIDGSTRLVVDYTEKNTNVSSLSGLQSFSIGVTSLTRSGSTVTVVTSDEHGYVTGKDVTISGVNEIEYNGTYTITVTSPSEFTYTIVSTPNTPATGSINSTYTTQINDLVLLSAQTNEKENGYYVAEFAVWRTIYILENANTDIKVRTNVDVDISIGNTPLITYNISSIESSTIGTGKVFAEVTTTEENGFATGNSIAVSGATVVGYNGTFEIERINGTKFRFEIPSALASDSTGTSEYQINDGDLVSVDSQADETENGLYVARSASAWELYGFFYKWDGTENDNVQGDYGDEVDENGYELNHYRKGYSLEETANFLKDKLDVQLEFGQFKGSNRDMGDHGAFVRWLMSGRKVNIGYTGKDKNIFVDGFGFGDPENVKGNERVNYPLDPSDLDVVEAKQSDISKENKSTIWGLTNHHSNALSGFFNKSPFLKDYPRVYNSEYDAQDPYDFLTGGHLPNDVDVERWRMTVTGTTTSTNSDVRPIMIDTLWYHRDNSYHNNITLDLKNSTMFGSHSISLVNNFDTPDLIALFGQEITDTDVTIGSPATITVPDASFWYEGDFVQFKVEDGNTLPNELDVYTTYKVATGYPSGNNIQLTDLLGTPINLSDAGSGAFTIERHVFDPYSNNEVIDSLDDIEGVTLNSGLSIIYKVFNGNVVNYYIKPRHKGSLNLIAPMGSWTPNSLSYDAAGPNGINIYLNSDETDFITFTHPTLLTADLLEELNQHNDMIPVPFDPTATDIDSLTSIFVDNTLIDYTDDINKTNKIRSKKTFVHLPTPIELDDGAQIDLDISLPTVPETDSFPFNTVGSLSGYKNYVTQPRLYVLGGYQSFNCTNYMIQSLTHVDGLATMLLNDDHGIYSSTFTDTEIDINTNEIRISNWKDISVGDIVRFKNDGGTLPTSTPVLSTGTDYIVTEVNCDKIKISDDVGTEIDITSASGGGNHSLVIQSAIRFVLRDSKDEYYNDEFDGYVYDFNSIQFNVDHSAPSPASGPVVLDRVISTTGGNDVRGLTERYNASVFSPMPEVEFAEDGNIYHQSFDVNNLIGNGLTGEDRDIRTLLATVYPTTTNTFAWRIDNSPRVRMIKWSLMNVNALGGIAETGSFANVAYKRNKAIVNEFASVFKNGSDGVMSVYDNPLSYVDVTDPSYTQQQINAFVRIRYPDSLNPLTEDDLLSDEDLATVSSFNYQANDAYNELIGDFQKGRVKVEPSNSGMNAYNASLPANHSSVDEIPSSFFDSNVTSRFIDFTSVESMYSGTEYSAYERWFTKSIYTPRYIVDSQGFTSRDNYDVFKNVDSTLKSYINSYYFDVSERTSSAGNRYVPDILNPVIDAEFEFGSGTENKLVDYLVSVETDEVNINDLRRRLWDSSYTIPNATDRKIQNAYQLSSTTPTIEDSAKFYGASWIPFAKVFSTDGVAPSENAIVDIIDYSGIISGSYTEIDNTLDNAIASNLIAERFKENGYIDAFASVNSLNSTDSDKEEFIRNYVTGYSNRLPFRFYNGFKIAVIGKEDSTGYATDISSPLVDTESDNERIYTYSVNDYLNSYSTPPASLIVNYLNDNFNLSESGGNVANIPLYDLIESGYEPIDPSATLYTWDWPSLDGWTKQTNTFQDPSGPGDAMVSDGTLITDTEPNPIYRYDQTIGSSFVTESYIYPSDDQLLSFNTETSTSSDIDYHTVMNTAYAVVLFEDSPSGSFPGSGSNGAFLFTRKDGNPIDVSTGSSTANDFSAFDGVRLFTYIPNRLYRVLFARLSTNEFMVKIYDTTDNTLVGSHSSNVLFPNLLGGGSDGMDLILSTGRQNSHPELGYFDKQSYANELSDDEIRGLFGIVDDRIFSHDMNPSWWYFEEGNPTTDPENSKIKDMINVSGMNHIADRDFYVNKMKYNYTRIKMSFTFSKKMGRWLPLDYRQAPTSYLTPTFGATALKEKEKSVIKSGTNGSEVNDYITHLQPDVNNSFDVNVVGSRRLRKIGGDVEFNIGDIISIYADSGSESIAIEIDNIIEDGSDSIYVLKNDIPELLINQNTLKVSIPINTIITGQYPINLLTGVESRDLIWKNPVCLDPANMFEQLNNIPYWEMEPMNLNRGSYPFLTSEFPYDSNGLLVSELDHTFDPFGAEDYRFTRLIEPNLSSTDGINFVVPNNVHGGSIDPDNSLMLYQPHMWKVFWHMRPSVCAMDGCDIPSPTLRSGDSDASMADPVLNNMFCYPNARDPQFYVPFHRDMNTDWLNSGWLLFDARIDEPDTNPERDLYNEIDAAIDGDEERNDYWEVDGMDVTDIEREDAKNELE